MSNIMLFLRDVFDTDVGVDTLKPYIDADGSLLVEAMLGDPLLKKGLVFRHVWTDMLHTQPSFHHVFSYLAATRHLAVQDDSQVVPFIAKHAPIANLMPPQHTAGMCQNARNILGSKQAIREALHDKFAHRYGASDDTSLHLLDFWNACWKNSISVVKGFLQKASEGDTLADVYGMHKEIIDAGFCAEGHGFTKTYTPRGHVDSTTTLWDVLSDSVATDSSLSLLVMNASVLVIDASVEDTIEPWQVYGVLRWMNGLSPAGNLVLVATERVHNNLGGEPDWDTNIRPVYLAHASFLRYLPKKAGLCVVLSNDKPTCYLSTSKNIWLPLRPGVSENNIDLSAIVNTPSRTVSNSHFVHAYLQALHNASCQTTPIFYRFLLAYAHDNAERLDNVVPTQGSKNAVVVIDNRPNVLNAVAARITLANLKDGAWDLVVFCRKEHVSFYKSHMPENTQLVTDMPIASNRFSIALYNQMLKSTGFWRQLCKYDRVLLVQDDGMIVRAGLETHLAYDYIGAPWEKKNGYNSYMKDVCPSFVGNGGVSLRNPGAMVAVLETYEKESRALHFDGLQEIPEDVYFSRHTPLLGFKVPSYEEAQLFASEQVLNPASLGFHKCWPYHTYEAVKDYFNAYLSTPRLA